MWNSTLQVPGYLREERGLKIRAGPAWFRSRELHPKEKGEPPEKGKKLRGLPWGEKGKKPAPAVDYMKWGMLCKASSGVSLPMAR